MRYLTFASGRLPSSTVQITKVACAPLGGGGIVPQHLGASHLDTRCVSGYGSLLVAQGSGAVLPNGAGEKAKPLPVAGC
jgi:hypothetical protein